MMGELAIAAVTILTVVASNSFFYGKLTQRVYQLEEHKEKVERHFGWDGSPVKAGK